MLVMAAALAGMLAPIESYIQAEMRLNEIPGLSLAIVRGGAAPATRAYGSRSLLSGEPMTAETPVELASVSKSFTALAVLQLEKAGRLSLDRPAADFVPEFRRAATVRQLLTHTSGLARKHDFLAPCCGQPGEFDLRIAAERLSGAGLRPPGAFIYANSNYVLLAALVERVSGQPFARYLEGQILRPLGMTRTTVDRAEAQSWGLADQHERHWGRVGPGTSRFSGWPGSSLVKSSGTDMARYLAALLRGDAAGVDLIGDAPQQPPYSMGFFVTPRAEWLGGAAVLEHGGDIWGGNTAVVLAPEAKLGVAVLINAGINRAEAIARGVTARLAGAAAPAAARAPRTANPDFWATSFLAGSAVAFAGLVLFWWRFLVKRGGVPRPGWPQTPWAAIRAMLLLLMAGYLAFLPFGMNPPRASLPDSLRVTIPLLAGAMAAVFASAAVAGLMPSRKERM